MIRVVVKGLKDESRLLGLIIPKGNIIELDIEEAQAALVQAACGSGDIEMVGDLPPRMAKPAAPPAPEPEPAPLFKSEEKKPKGKG